MISRPERPAGRLVDRLLRSDLSDPSRVALAISLHAAALRLVALPYYWSVGPAWLGIQTALGLLLYLFLIAMRRLPDRQSLITFAYGPEWILWSASNVIAFGLGCSFQLYPLLLLPIFVLLFQRLEPRRRLALMGAPLLSYVPLVGIFWWSVPLVELPSNHQRWLAASNELIVSTTVVLVAGAALLEQVRARRLAEVREAAQAQLVEDLSHELRTPLATLLTAAQGAQAARQSPQRVTESLEWIESAARSAARLVEGLLDLADLDHGRVAASSPIELSRGVRNAVDRLRPLAQPRGIVLEIHEEALCPEAVDEASLEVVMRNLVANAISHSGAGKRVEIRILRENGRPRIEVEDRGEGIAPEHLPRVFDRLWRADPARSRGEGRYGLGLSIAHRHAELLGADIEVASEVGKGSVFSLVMR